MPPRLAEDSNLSFDFHHGLITKAIAPFNRRKTEFVRLAAEFERILSGSKQKV